MNPRVLVTGSRSPALPRSSVHVALTAAWREAGRPITVVQGDCPTGADAYAREWAADHAVHGIELEHWPADWARWGRRAGPARNASMVSSEPRIWRALAWPLGESPGTRGCIRLAQAAGLDVRVHEEANR